MITIEKTMKTNGSGIFGVVSNNSKINVFSTNIFLTLKSINANINTDASLYKLNTGSSNFFTTNYNSKLNVN
jgi:hypothetical protein